MKIPENRRTAGAVLASLLIGALLPLLLSPPATALSQAFPAVADAKVESKDAQLNFGSSSSIRTDGSPRAETYVRFEVAGLNGPVSRVTLRLFATDSTGDGPQVFATDTSWSETGITFDSGRPDRTSGVLDDKASIASNAFVDFDVTGAVGGDGTYSFNLAQAGSDGLNYRSREASADRPQLIVETVDDPNAPPPPATARFGAEADARVDSGSAATTNFGTVATLTTDGSSEKQAYLRFVVAGLNGSVTSATVRLYATNATVDGPEIFSTETAWSETGITFNSGRPARTSGPLDNKGAITSPAFVDFDVTAAVTGNSTYSFNLAQPASDGADFRSREASGNRPELIVTATTGPDTTAPDTRIDSGPNGTVPSASATFAFSSTKAASTFGCRLDGGSFSPCASPKTYGGLGDGTHTFEVRATDDAGNTDATPASRTWTIDSSTPAVATYAAVVDAKVESGSPTTNFGNSTTLRADNSPEAQSYLRFVVADVSGRVTNATLRLFATDSTGDGPSVFTTETAWSETGITFNAGRPARTSGALDDEGAISSNAFVDFDVTVAVSGNGTYSFNVSPTSSDGLDFSSREAATNRPQLIVTTDPRPDTTAPDTTIDAGPSGTVGSPSASFRFSSNEIHSTFQCRLDGAAFSSCTSPQSYSGLPDGRYTFDVRAIDAAGNVDSSPASRTWTIDTSAGSEQVLVGAGDIADCGNSGDDATAALLDEIPGTVYALGDNVYPDATANEFTNCYGPNWGRHKNRTRPAAGNHEYHTSGASGYYNYFGAAAGDPAEGYYSYDLGGWKVIVLNSNCSQVGGCGKGSPQERWLRAELAASAAECTVAYWHHPRFSSGSVVGSSSSMGPFWDALYEYGADVVLAGHEHNYERFARQTPGAAADPEFGIRQFVVGTGGKSHFGFSNTIPNSEVRNNDTYGVMKLTLRASSYEWEFVPEAGKTFRDSGSESCHGAPSHAQSASAGSGNGGGTPMTPSKGEVASGTSWAEWDQSPEAASDWRCDISPSRSGPTGNA